MSHAQIAILVLPSIVAVIILGLALSRSRKNELKWQRAYDDLQVVLQKAHADRDSAREWNARSVETANKQTDRLRGLDMIEIRDGDKPPDWPEFMRRAIAYRESFDE